LAAIISSSEAEATMPTVLDSLREHLLGDEIADRVEQALAAMSAAWTTKLATAVDRKEPPVPEASNVASGEPGREPMGILGVILGVGLKRGKVIEYLDELPPSPGYEPLLVDAGWSRVAARGVVALALQRGNRLATESKWRRQAVNAIRFLTRKRQVRAVRKRAELLVKASQTTTVETIFSEADLDDSEFLFLLSSVVEGRQVDYERIREIAALISPRLAVSRGPRVRIASAVHEFFLDPKIGLSPKRHPPGYQNRDAEYVNPLTAATRLEFGDPDFDSRPARRRTTRQRANSRPK
jgi:hypothetical protein